jgi:predicted ATP-binding protein involved in virulence
MNIESAQIRNFKGIQELDLNLNSQLNIFIGDNGSGKTAVLEALITAAGSLFIGVRDVSTKAILNSEIAFRNEEYQFPVEIKASGTANTKHVLWSRERNSLRGSTTIKNANPLSQIGREFDEAVRSGLNIPLPVISYFSTGRLFLNAQDRSRKKKEPSIKELGSRLRGYRQSFDAKSNFKRFTEWFRLKEMSQIQRNEQDVLLNLVKTAITDTLPGCKKVYYDFNPDTGIGLTVELSDGRILPFNYLSDGLRSFLAMIADIAHRCVLLNPFLGENALKKTEGIVFIDELDLHLHPSWQKIIVKSLLTTFPKIQFIASTHSPFIVQETEVGQLFIMDNCALKSVNGASSLSIEDIAEFIQGVEMPQWSRKRKEMFSIAKEYYQAVKEDKVTEELKDRFQESMKPFSSNTAYHAILEQERILKEYNKNNSSS